MSGEQRTAVITGAASGIGAATAEMLRGQGVRVIGVDRAEVRQGSVDISADLSSPGGRARMVEETRRLAPAGIDCIVANAGVRAETDLSVRVNHFGAVATLEGLRPLLRPGAPRAVLVASRATLLAVNDAIVEACLAGDEESAVALAGATGGERVYSSSKRAVTRWLRRTAPTAVWAGAGIPLNAVAPGTVATPMIAHRTPEEQAALSAGRPMPLGGLAEAAEVAAAIGWFLREDNTKVTGQILFVDGGGEALLRGDEPWAATSTMS